MVSESRILRKILGSKMEEVTGGCRKLYVEERHGL
jgi:hypothetical protein